MKYVFSYISILFWYFIVTFLDISLSLLASEDSFYLDKNRNKNWEKQKNNELWGSK